MVHMVNCPECGDGSAEVDDIESNLEYISIICKACKQSFAIGIRDWEIDGVMEVE